MIKVNLLPYREKEKKENFVQQIFIIAGSFIFFILLAKKFEYLQNFFYLSNLSKFQMECASIMSCNNPSSR